MTDYLTPLLGEDGRIVEGILTTINEDGSVNIAPMGPIVDQEFQQFVLRPFQTSTSYQNLKRTGQAVFHVTDDVGLFAQAALAKPRPMPAMEPALAVEGFVLTDTCRWYALQVHRLDDSQLRTTIEASCVDQGNQREFLGFNRAQHAVLEAAILATRVHLLPADEILSELKRLESPVTKTASRREQQAFDFIYKHVQSTLVATSK